jgi:hypothetical protein
MLSVQQFVSHLDRNAQQALFTSKDAFLKFLRSQYQAHNAQAVQLRRDLECAARTHASGERIRVTAQPEERSAAQAVLYAVMRLADRLRTAVPTTVNNKRSAPTGDAPKRWRTGYSGAGGWVTRDDFYPRFPLVVTITAGGRETARLNVRTDKLGATLEQVKRGCGYTRRYVAAVAAQALQGERLAWTVSHPRAEALARRMVLEARSLARRCPRLTAPPVCDCAPVFAQSQPEALPSLEVIPEMLEVSETAHFAASSRETGYGRALLDGEEVARVRCWCADESELEVNAARALIRGGTIRRVQKPGGTPPLRRDEGRVIELCNGAPGQRSERLYGRGTRDGEIWLRGTADREVMARHMGALVRKQARADANAVN